MQLITIILTPGLPDQTIGFSFVWQKIVYVMFTKKFIQKLTSLFYMPLYIQTQTFPPLNQVSKKKKFLTCYSRV